MFQEILLPTDGSEGVGQAINAVVAMAEKFDARIHVLFVAEPPRFHEYGASVALTNIMQSLQEAGRQILDDTAERIRSRGLSSVETALRQGHPAEEIFGYADEHGIELIVMGTHGRRGINRMLLGSITEEVVRTSHVPVMTVRMTSD